ncbi:MAG: hypothetical protein ABEI99_06525, partial [Halobaculum sp.]
MADANGGGAGDDGDDDEFADIRADDENALWRLFRTYGRGQLLRFVGGGVASVVRMSMELVPSLMLAVAIDSLFFDTSPFRFAVFGVDVIPQAWLPATDGQRLLFVGSIVVAAYALNSVM